MVHLQRTCLCHEALTIPAYRHTLITLLRFNRACHRPILPFKQPYHLQFIVSAWRFLYACTICHVYCHVPSLITSRVHHVFSSYDLLTIYYILPSLLCTIYCPAVLGCSLQVGFVIKATTTTGDMAFRHMFCVWRAVYAILPSLSLLHSASLPSNLYPLATFMYCLTGQTLLIDLLCGTPTPITIQTSRTYGQRTRRATTTT